MNELEKLRFATNSVSAIVVTLDLMQRLLARVNLEVADRAAVDSCLHEMNESVTLLRTLVTQGGSENGGESS
ncbi:MAG TPA: hypothetical protein VGK67_03590 [Myxococcales bacterium]|jgi:hypothetical protein